VRYWLIGCGALLIIVIVLGAVGYNMVKNFAQEYGSEVNFVLKEYRDLDRDFPFTPPADGVIGKEDYAAFIACRRDLLKAIGEHFEDFKKEETSWKDRISMVVNMIPKLGTAHVKALRKAGLSPAAYRWMVNLTLTALRYAERGDAPPELKTLRKDLDSLFKEDNPLKPKKSGPVAAEASDRRKLEDILPGMDPLFISLPPEDIALITANADGIRDTEKVFFFDASFLETETRGLEKPSKETSKER